MIAEGIIAAVPELNKDTKWYMTKCKKPGQGWNFGWRDHETIALAKTDW